MKFDFPFFKCYIIVLPEFRREDSETSGPHAEKRIPDDPISPRTQDP